MGKLTTSKISTVEDNLKDAGIQMSIHLTKFQMAADAYKKDPEAFEPLKADSEDVQNT